MPELLTCYKPVAPSPNCAALQYVEGVFFAIGVPSTSLLFLLRVRAVYGNSKLVTVFFGITWLAISGTSVLILTGISGGEFRMLHGLHMISHFFSSYSLHRKVYRRTQTQIYHRTYPSYSSKRHLNLHRNLVADVAYFHERQQLAGEDRGVCLGSWVAPCLQSGSQRWPSILLVSVYSTFSPSVNGSLYIAQLSEWVLWRPLLFFLHPFPVHFILS